VSSKKPVWSVLTRDAILKCAVCYFLPRRASHLKVAITLLTGILARMARRWRKVCHEGRNHTVSPGAATGFSSMALTGHLQKSIFKTRA
jgi:uncharacterized iron-regulated protein